MKKITLILVMLLALMTAVFAAPELNISDFDDMAANQNDGVITGSFVIKNNGDAIATSVSFDDDYESSSDEVSVTYSNTSFDLGIGESKTIDFSIDVTNQKSKAYTLTLHSSYTLVGDVVSNLIINPNQDLNTSTNTNSITVAKGFSNEITLTLKNTGNVNTSGEYYLFDSVGIGVDSTKKPFSLSYGSTLNLPIDVDVLSSINNGNYSIDLVVEFNSQTKTIPVSVIVVDASTAIVVSGDTNDQEVDLAKKNTYEFTVTNTGTAPSTVNITMTGDLDDEFESVVYTPSGFTLAGGATQIVTVIIDNSDEDERPSSLDYYSIYEGIFTVDDGKNKSTYTLNLQPKSEIEIDDGSFEIKLNGKKKSDDVKNVYPGDEISIELELKNLYSNSEDVEMTDYTVTLIIDDMDNGDEVEIEVEGSAIDASDEDKVDITFTVPYLVEKTKYDVFLEVEAEDEHGNMHYDSNEDDITISITKESHKMIFDNVKLDSSIVTCDYPTVYFEADVLNLGKYDEDDVVLTAEILGSNYKTTETSDIDKTDYKAYGDFLTVSSLPSGDYTLRITAQYDDGAQEIGEDLRFTVQCDSTQVVIPDEGTTGGDDSAVDDANDFIDLSDDFEGSDSQNSKDMIYVLVLAALILLVLVGIVVLGSKLLKKD